MPMWLARHVETRTSLVHVSVNVLEYTCNFYCWVSLNYFSSSCFLLLNNASRLSAYAHERIICMWKQSKTPAAFVWKLAEDSICTTLWPVKRRIFPWSPREMGWKADTDWVGCHPLQEIAEYMDRILEEEDELTASEFHHLVTGKFSARISTPTIRWFLMLKLQWIIVRAVPTTLEGPLPPPDIAMSWYRPLQLIRQWCPLHRRECALHSCALSPSCTNCPSTRLVLCFFSETWCERLGCSLSTV